MSRLIAVVSPAKSLDDQSHYPHLECTQPQFSKEAEYLVGKLTKLSAKQLGEKMDLSPALSELNKKRYADWHLPFTHSNAHPAILMFKGEVYRGLNAVELSESQLKFANDHLRIISGLYGVLRPLDLVMPYRLMMGTPFSPDAKNKNLYSFWQKNVTCALREDIDAKGVLVNLASEEYFKTIDTKALGRKIVHCEFKERKGDKLSIIGTYAKLARGMMARFLIENKISKVADLKAFDTNGYTFSVQHSDEERYTFIR